MGAKKQPKRVVFGGLGFREGCPEFTLEFFWLALRTLTFWVSI